MFYDVRTSNPTPWYAMNSRENIAGLALCLLMVVAICPYRPGYDMEKMRATIISLTGLAAIAVLLVRGEFPATSLVFAPFFGYVVVRALFSFTPGYTWYEIARYVGIYGLIVYAARCPRPWVAISIVLCAVVQFVVKEFELIKFQHQFTNLGYGTVRNLIRYATIMFAAGIASFAFVSKQRPKWAIVVLCAVGAYATYQAVIVRSHTLIAVCGLTALIVVVFFVKGWVVRVVILAACVASIMFSSKMNWAVASGGAKAYTLDKVREPLWQTLADEATLMGRGLGGWELLAGSLGHEGAGHPHNSIGKMLFELGVPGVTLFLLGVTLMVVFVCVWGKEAAWFAVGAGMVLVATTTNDLFGYNDVVMMWSLLTGGALHVS